MRFLNFVFVFLILPTILFTLDAGVVVAQGDHNEAPIRYKDTHPRDRVAQLQKLLSSNQNQIKWDEDHGWLPDLLKKLNVPSTSQTLVFSKTSQQHQKINPSNPRAIYFNDDVYIGFVPRGDFLEIAAVDPVQGAVFYTLDQNQSAKAKIKRASSICLSCHENHRTQRVPGFLIRSVYPKRTGHPEFRYGTTSTDHRTDLMDRFGGWYVTGRHGVMRHRGNVLVIEDADSDKTALDRESGANQVRLPSRVRKEKYLQPTSDIVALMLMEHQVQFHNFVTQASYETRIALHQQKEMNRLLEQAEHYRSDSTKRRINSVANELVEYLFFVDEFKLSSPIQGSEEFIKDFRTSAIYDSKQRSLRDLDLKTRLLKYPCSYLVYTDSFTSLPKPVLDVVVKKMKEVLSGENQSTTFQHLTEQDRKAILQILVETHPLFKED